MDGRKAKSRAQGNRKQNINAANEKIKELSLRLNREVKKIAKLERNELECNKQYSLQIAYFQEKLKILTNKIGKLQREVTKRKQLSIENENLKKEILDLKIKLNGLKPANVLNGKSTEKKQRQMATRSRTLSLCIHDVIDEFEKQIEPPAKEASPPSVSIYVFLFTTSLG